MDPIQRQAPSEQVVRTYNDRDASANIKERLALGDRVVSMVALEGRQQLLVVFDRAPMIQAGKPTSEAA